MTTSLYILQKYSSAYNKLTGYPPMGYQMGGDTMLVAKASFEFLPVKIGGLGEAVTSIAT